MVWKLTSTNYIGSTRTHIPTTKNMKTLIIVMISTSKLAWRLKLLKSKWNYCVYYAQHLSRWNNETSRTDNFNDWTHQNTRCTVL